MPKLKERRFFELVELSALPIAIWLFWVCCWGIMSVILWDKDKAAYGVEKVYLKVGFYMNKTSRFAYAAILWFWLTAFVAFLFLIFLYIIKQVAQ